MAKRAVAQIVQNWANGESTAFMVSLPADFPDVLHEAAGQAKRMFEEGIAYIQALEAVDDGDEAR